MIALSPLALKKTAEVLLVANNPTYVVRKVMELGYASAIASRMSSDNLEHLFRDAAKRSNFERYDDATMILTFIGLAHQGESRRVTDVQPKRKPKLFDGETRCQFDDYSHEVYKVGISSTDNVGT